MVDRGRYLGGNEGAPPVPPPGGYRGARRAGMRPDAPRDPAATPDNARTNGTAQPLTPTETGAGIAPASDPRKGTAALGWIALAASALFALVLIFAAVAGVAIYTPTMIVLQALVIAVIVAALFSARSRKVAAIAAVLALLCNVATMGAVGAVTASARNDYDGAKSVEQQHEENFPGVKDVPSDTTLSQPSLEKVRSTSDALMKEIRERLTERFGYTWVKAGDPLLRNERNGYGGESLLRGYTSQTWATKEPVQDNERKREVEQVVNEVLSEKGIYPLTLLSAPGSGISDDMTAKLYGSKDVDEQHTWEWATDAYPDPYLIYMDAYDTSKDSSGEFQKQREAQSKRTGEPVEGLQLFVIAHNLLSDNDREEFEKLLPEYPGY